jgi:SOS response associated peptidase (SRAP)
MCGRFVQTMPAEAMRQLFRTTGPLPNLAPSWNVAPTQTAPVVRRHPETGERHLDPLRWGLLPRWVKDPKGAKQPINARAETVATSPMFPALALRAPGAAGQGSRMRTFRLRWPRVAKTKRHHQRSEDHASSIRSAFLTAR